MSSRRVLILTATVTPHPQMGALAVKVPEERFTQYCDAFSFLVASGATTLFDHILLCENSGFDLTRFADSFAGSACDVEYVSIPMDDSAGRYGRVYSEMHLIDRALQQAGDIVDEDDRVWKLTGRYQINNLERVVTKTDQTADLVVALRRFPAKWTDLYLFCFNLRAWKSLSARFDELETTSGGAAVMYDIIGDLSRSGLKVKDRLGIEPHLLGIRGHDQRNYDSPRQRLKRRTRQVLRAIVPGLRV
ncbi:MAG: hypothetical protein QM622_07135 [Microbacterium sp.]